MTVSALTAAIESVVQASASYFVAQDHGGKREEAEALQGLEEAKAALLALYGQPFTQEEAEHLRYVAEQTDWNKLRPIVEKVEARLLPATG